MSTRSLAARAALCAAVVVTCVTTTLGTALAAPAPTPATPAAGAAPAGRYVVILKDQLPGTPAGTAHAAARANSAGSSQQSVLGRLRGSKPGNVKHFSLGNAFAANVTGDQVSQLAADPSVSAVVPNVSIPMTPPQKTIADATPADNTGVCPADPSKPLLEPEALGLVHANSSDGSPSAAGLANGSGVKVGVLADGFDDSLPDFIRPNGKNVVTDYQDFTGDGAPGQYLGEANGDVSTIAAQGVVHDLHDFSSTIPVGCTVKITGIAPGADITELSGIGATNSLAGILQGIDYAANTAHDNVLNESFGLNTVPDGGARDAIELFNDEATAAGVTVVASSGDAGTNSTIGTPAVDPNIISVGATTALRTVAQQGKYGSNSQWADNNIGEFSSSGFTNAGSTVSLVAPGIEGWIAEAGQPGNITPFGGTSESAPFVAGTAALVIQAYKQAHDGKTPTPAVVKSLIVGTADDIGANAQDQGAGLLDARAAVEAALTYPGATGTQPASITAHAISSVGQFNLSGKAGSTQTAKTTITNVGDKTITVAPSMRVFQPETSTTTNLTLAGGSVTTVPIDADANCAQIRVSVYNQTIVNGGGNVFLYSPIGTLENLSLPQGVSGYSTVSSDQCTSGTWTLSLPAQMTGSTTIVASTFTDAPVGQVSPAAFTLAPGAGRAVTAKVEVPANAGDYAYSLLLAQSNGHTTTVPVTLRSVLATSGAAANFTGTFTGGNGRAGFLGEASSATYAIDVPAGKPALNVAVTLHGTTGQPFDLVHGTLVDPDGETASQTYGGDLNLPGGLNADPSAANALAHAPNSPLAKLATASGAPATSDDTTTGLDVSTVAPQAGRWLLILDQVGLATTGSQTYTGTISTKALLSATTPNLPTTAGTTLAAGTPVTVPVTITNHGMAPELVQADPRTTTKQNYQLVPTLYGIGPGSADGDLPGTTAAFGVPAETSKLTVVSAAAQPTFLNAQNDSGQGGIILNSSLSQAQNGSTIATATAQETTPTVTPGVWFTDDSAIGPFPTPASNLPVRVTASASTLGFDRTMTTDPNDPTNVAIDPYLAYVDPTIDLGTTYAYGAEVDPGQSITFPVTITPTGKAGTVVKGTLNIVSDSGYTHQLAIPYTYTVGPKAKTTKS